MASVSVPSTCRSATAPEISPRPSDLAEGLLFPGWYHSSKDVVDFLVALLLLIIAGPVILLAALLVRLTSRGPAFYTQLRVGLHGRLFWVIKLRTMKHNCEGDSGPKWATAKDPRVTWIGSLLRRTHLDELPQLWNVLRGEMSLVGPRPERPEFVSPLEMCIPLYRDRLLVRPGITGLAQVQLPPDTDIESVRRKLAYDLYYVQRVSLWGDLRILLSTVLKVLGFPFVVLRAVAWLPRPEVVRENYAQLIAPAELEPRMQPA
jgi:lipopolysaccharide/colanic/teichoic acid biosynthesis glycosyltransferase